MSSRRRTRSSSSARRWSSLPGLRPSSGSRCSSIAATSSSSAAFPCGTAPARRQVRRAGRILRHDHHCHAHAPSCFFGMYLGHARRPARSASGTIVAHFSRRARPGSSCIWPSIAAQGCCSASPGPGCSRGCARSCNSVLIAAALLLFVAAADDGRRGARVRCTDLPAARVPRRPVDATGLVPRAVRDDPSAPSEPDAARARRARAAGARRGRPRSRSSATRSCTGGVVTRCARRRAGARRSRGPVRRLAGAVPALSPGSRGAGDAAVRDRDDRPHDAAPPRHRDCARHRHRLHRAGRLGQPRHSRCRCRLPACCRCRRW